jgi:hypothetical protein
MATTFPTGLDVLVNPSSSSNLNDVGVEHDEQHANANDAIEALQAKVGIDGSAVTTSLDYKVANKQSKVLFTGAPASASATGTEGTIVVSGGFLYVCTATNTWVRSAIATW